ncbi:MAG: hypothetical protein RL702_1899 [Pseudomonadota bacterium]
MAANDRLAADLAGAVGRRFVKTAGVAFRRHTRGYRTGEGQAAAVVLPGSLVEMWRVLRICNRHGAIVIAQAANTGLTGGSTPCGDYDRKVVVVNTRRLDRIHVVRGGERVICLPGATLDQLERRLAPLGREPHSVIGSSCLGASVIGGVCNSSGGALIQRGPAYTELALFARCDESGRLTLVNRLGIELPGDPEAMLQAIEAGRWQDADLKGDTARASASDYEQRLRDVDAPSPARYNADPGYLRDASGSAGHVVVFAVQMDTFPAPSGSSVFCVGTNDPDDLARLRRGTLTDCPQLPISAEYLHRDAFEIAATHGKDMFLAIRLFGTRRLAALERVGASFNAVMGFAGPNLFDRFLHWLAVRLPGHLPRGLVAMSRRYEHLLLVKVAAAHREHYGAYLRSHFPADAAAVRECAAQEGAAAFLHRFVCAGAAIRAQSLSIGQRPQLVALDIALPRNAADWFEVLPPSLDRLITKKLYYGHFFCHVFHHDYLLPEGVDCAAVKQGLLEFQNRRGAKYPAEHNVGHIYQAEPTLAQHYQALDPCNVYNPGVGLLPKGRNWSDAEPHDVYGSDGNGVQTARR